MLWDWIKTTFISVCSFAGTLSRRSIEISAFYSSFFTVRRLEIRNKPQMQLLYTNATTFLTRLRISNPRTVCTYCDNVCRLFNHTITHNSPQYKVVANARAKRNWINKRHPKSLKFTRLPQSAPGEPPPQVSGVEGVGAPRTMTNNFLRNEQCTATTTCRRERCSSCAGQCFGTNLRYYLSFCSMSHFLISIHKYLSKGHLASSPVQCQCTV